MTTSTGEADGYGEQETVVVYARLDGSGYPETWRIRIDDGPEPLDQKLRAGSKFSYPRVVGGADVDRDGNDEWFVKVLNLAGHGATWGVFNLFFFRDRFRVLTLARKPMPLYLGGISRTGEGVTCPDGGLVQLRAEALNRRNTNWHTSQRVYRIEGTRAFLNYRDADRLHLSDYNDPDLDKYYELNCDDLHYEV